MTAGRRTTVLISLLVLALAVYFIFVRDKKPEDTLDGVELERNESDAGFRGDPLNAVYTFEDGPITLSDGRAEIDIVPGSALVEEIFLTGQVAYGDIDADGKSDAAVVIVRSGGGSGSFVYVGALVSGAINYTGTNALLVGDRVTPENISISSGIITLEYLDRAEDEPMAEEPTIAKVKRYSYRGGELEEI